MGLMDGNCKRFGNHIGKYVQKELFYKLPEGTLWASSYVKIAIMAIETVSFSYKQMGALPQLC